MVKVYMVRGYNHHTDNKMVFRGFDPNEYSWIFTPTEIQYVFRILQ